MRRSIWDLKASRDLYRVNDILAKIGLYYPRTAEMLLRYPSLTWNENILKSFVLLDEYHFFPSSPINSEFDTKLALILRDCAHSENFMSMASMWWHNIAILSIYEALSLENLQKMESLPPINFDIFSDFFLEMYQKDLLTADNCDRFVQSINPDNTTILAYLKSNHISDQDFMRYFMDCDVLERLTKIQKLLEAQNNVTEKMYQLLYFSIDFELSREEKFILPALFDYFHDIENFVYIEGDELVKAKLIENEETVYLLCENGMELENLAEIVANDDKLFAVINPINATVFCYFHACFSIDFFHMILSDVAIEVNAFANRLNQLNLFQAEYKPVLDIVANKLIDEASKRVILPHQIKFFFIDCCRALSGVNTEPEKQQTICSHVSLFSASQESASAVSPPNPNANTLNL